MSDVLKRMRPPRFAACARRTTSRVIATGTHTFSRKMKSKCSRVISVERRLLVRAEVVHEHVDAAERGPRLGDEPLRFAVREQIGLHVARVLVVAEQPLHLGAFRERLLGRDDDLRPARGERLRDAEADALAAAR